MKIYGRSARRTIIALTAMITLFATGCSSNKIDSTDADITSSEEQVSSADANENTEEVDETASRSGSGITDGTVNFYFVRHGKTIMNTMDLVQGWSDSPLTDQGVEVAKNTGTGLSDIIFDYAYSSDRGRAVETAQIILAANEQSSGIPFKKDARLRESDYGSFEGTPANDMREAIVKYLKLESVEQLVEQYGLAGITGNVANADPSGIAETEQAVKERLLEAIHAITEEISAKGGGNVLLVGHGASLQTLISALTGTDVGGLDNASVSLVTYKDDKYTTQNVNDMTYAERGAEVRAQKEVPVTIYLTRHGKTHFNTTDQVQGWIDSPLTEEGRETATHLGKGLSDVIFSAVYTSGMGRADETAELVLLENAAGSDLEIQANPDIRETNYGKYEGGTNDAMFQAAMEYYGIHSMKEFATENQSGLERILYHNYISDETGEAENLFELLARVGGGFREIVTEASENGGGNILVVSHGNAIMAILNSVGVKDAGDIENASVTKIIYQNGVYTVEAVNDMSYVNAGAVK